LFSYVFSAKFNTPQLAPLLNPHNSGSVGSYWIQKHWPKSAKLNSEPCSLPLSLPGKYTTTAKTNVLTTVLLKSLPLKANELPVITACLCLPVVSQRLTNKIQFERQEFEVSPTANGEVETCNVSVCCRRHASVDRQ